jgi:hypothetical protein
MYNLCAPALIYVAFSLTQIIIDAIKGLYNTSLVKFIVMVMITILLNELCQRGLDVVSWIIVFIPFIMMSVITTVILYIFGLNSAIGTLNYNKTTHTNSNSNITTATNVTTIKTPIFTNFLNSTSPAFVWS